MCVSAGEGQRKASDPHKLELQAAVSSLTWVLGSQLGSSGRTASAINYGLSLRYFKKKNDHVRNQSMKQLANISSIILVSKKKYSKDPHCSPVESMSNITLDFAFKYDSHHQPPC